MGTTHCKGANCSIFEFNQFAFEATFPRYECSLKRGPGEELGLVVADMEDGALVICALGEGLIESWNTLNPEQPVRRGDHIVKVNGVEDKSSMISAFHHTVGELSMQLRRQDAYRIVVSRKRGACLGLKLAEPSGDALTVYAVTKGSPLDTWNSQRPQELQVRKGDRIVEVNGIKGEAKVMCEEFQRSDDLELEICRRARWLLDRFGHATSTGSGSPCPICLLPLRPANNIIQLPCMHEFCTPCLESWLHEKNSCPVCRTPLGGGDFPWCR